MLKKHIIDALSVSNLSAEQKQQMRELFISIKDNEALLTELNSIDSAALRANLKVQKSYLQKIQGLNINL